MKFTRLKIVKRLPFVRNVTGAILDKIEKLGISVGGFGRQLPEDFENIDGDEEMVDEDVMSDGRQLPEDFSRIYIVFYNFIN